MAGSSIVSLVSLILLAAGVLFQFFVVLSGGVDGGVEPNFYFLTADTSNIRGAARTTTWTFFSLCGYNQAAPSIGGTTIACGAPTAALRFDFLRNFGANPDNITAQYYTSGAMFGFYIVALFFSCIALLAGFLALCTRLGAYLSGFLSFLALIFQGIAAALMTVWTVKARNALQAAGHSAYLGRYSYGFTWGAFAAFFISVILFCVAPSLGKEKSYAKKSRFGAFGRKRSTRSRGSFGGDGAIKDEYS